MKNLKNGKMLLALALALCLSVGAVALAADTKTQIPQEEIDAILNTETDPSQVTSPFITVAESVRSSVVGINNYQVVRRNIYDYYGFGFGFGYYGDGRDQDEGERLYATGSGVLVSNYGHVLTNYHVIEDATKLTVTIEGSDQEYPAEVVSYDENTDVAVLLVTGLPDTMKAVTLGDSDQLQVGEWAIVIGNPLSETFARTVTVGVVSAMDREIVDRSVDKYGRRTNITNKMIQVDAAINNGNSGGGMFNMLGQLMGIPERKYTSNGLTSASVDNIGMCIPINVAKPVIEDALNKYNNGDSGIRSDRGNTAAQGSRPLLGVTVTNVGNTSNILPYGALVREVNDNSNASRAGIQPGDIIVEVNGKTITSSQELVNCIQSYDEGDELEVMVYRVEGLAEALKQGSLSLSDIPEDGEYITLKVTLIADTAA